MSYYKAINNVGTFSSSIKQLIASLIIFPIFIFLCGRLENFGNYVSARLKSLVTSNTAAPDTSPDRNSAGVL
jgi:hypothetical protein